MLLGALLLSALTFGVPAQSSTAAPPASNATPAIDIAQTTRDAEAGNPVAQVRLAIAYTTGTGIAQDYKQAATWLRKAADQGYPAPQYLLGNMYANGTGVLQDYKEAAVWFQKAADQGYPQALVVLGVMYREGSGVPKDLVAAHKWFNLSAALATSADDQKQYASNRDQLAPSMNSAQIDQAQTQARAWLDDFRRRGAGIPPPPPPPPPAEPVLVGANIPSPSKIKDVLPVYPPIALSARVQGVVTVDVTIGTTGKVERAQVVHSIPLLDGAALDAVKQWEYTPTLLNGAPVPVTMTVTVTFSLK